MTRTRSSQSRETQISHEERMRRQAVARSGINRVQRYHVRARFQGMMQFICPYCGWMGKYRLWYRQYWFQCQQCHAHFIPRFGGCYIPMGRHLPPPDFMIPDAEGEGQDIRESFPSGDLLAWHTQGCVHGLVLPGTDEYKQTTEELGMPS